MRDIILIRHGITEWNEQGRIQGQTDVSLAEAGERQCRHWRLPGWLNDAVWYASTLSRTQATARLMGCRHFRTENALMEMNWGEWTGRHLRDLRRELGSAMRENEDRGLDFQPPAGESPRMVRDRVAHWLAELPSSDDPVIAITHKGVIRAAISHATGWDLKQDFDEKLQRQAWHHFRLDDNGSFNLVKLNLPLV